jgi:hypothetical protein
MNNTVANKNHPSAGPPEALDGIILGLIGDSEPLEHDERRLRERFPIYCKMLLTPIDHEQNAIVDEAADIFGKDISTTGMCFTHDLPVAQGRIAISLTHPEIGQLNVEAEIIWSRQTLIGLYETGCRLIRKIPGHSITLRA